MLAKPILVALSLLGATGCKGTGAACERDANCRAGHRCELRQCVGEEQPTCGYLRRCLPRLDPARARALLGPLLPTLDSHPDEQACRQRLRLLDSTGKLPALRSACGPRVTGQ